MAFTQPCFIRKNTTELRKKLEELGYKYSTFDDLRLDGIITFPDRNHYSVWAEYHFNGKHTLKSWIDCGDNEELFFALSALRDDTNENQWFIAQRTMWDENYNGEITVYYEEGEWLLWNYYTFMEDMPSDFRKATVEEIIEHFKDR